MRKINIGNEIWEVDGEKELDKYFPKGDDRRGQAIAVLAMTKLEERQRIIEIIEKLKDCQNGYPHKCGKHTEDCYFVIDYTELIKEIEK